MATSPSQAAIGPVGLTIKTNGKAIPDTLGVLSVKTDAKADGHAKAWIRVEAGSLASNEFPIVDGPVFKPGNKISIAAFYGSGADQPLFEGVITALRFLFVQGEPLAEVQCAQETAPPTPQLSDPVLTITAGVDMLDCDLGLEGDASETFAKVSGSVTFPGSGLARPGVTLEIKGLGQRFNGLAVVTAVQHALSAGDWATVAFFGAGADVD